MNRKSEYICISLCAIAVCCLHFLLNDIKKSKTPTLTLCRQSELASGCKWKIRSHDRLKRIFTAFQWCTKWFFLSFDYPICMLTLEQQHKHISNGNLLENWTGNAKESISNTLIPKKNRSPNANACACMCEAAQQIALVLMLFRD